MEWKDVVGYEGIYEVSDCGQVRTKKGKTTYTERHGVRTWKQRVLKQKVSKDGNHRVHLWKCGKEKTLLVHRLVASAFIPEVPGKEYVNHKDGSRYNNAVSNLEWCTHTENNNHAFDNDLILTSQKVVLVDLKTKEPHFFRSMAKASVFLGRNPGFISGVLKKGLNEIDGHLIFVEAVEKEVS